MLSGGATLGLFHLGRDQGRCAGEGLLPRVISGSSAGSIIAAMLGTRTDALVLARLFEPHSFADAWRSLGFRNLLPWRRADGCRSAGTLHRGER